MRRSMMAKVLVLTWAMAALLSGYSLLDAYDRNKGNQPEKHVMIDRENACGIVCMSVVSHLLDRPMSLAMSRRLIAVDSLGRTTMANLVDGLTAAGFKATAISSDERAIEKVEDPIVLFVNDNHFIVIKNNRGWTTVFDPPNPPFVTSLEKLEYVWKGEAIIVQLR